MSNYTIELRYLCEYFAGKKQSQGYRQVNDIIADSRKSIFCFDYPIFDEAYRSVLETKIIRHFYTREISEETFGLWMLKLDTKMNEIMPRYNQIYDALLHKFDDDYLFFNNYDMNVDGSRKSTGTSSGTSQSRGEGTNAYSETPQGSLTGVETNKYLTTADKSTNQNYTNSNGAATSNEGYLEHRTGRVMNAGTLGYQIMFDYIEKIIDVDMMIIRDLEELFFQLW